MPNFSTVILLSDSMTNGKTASGACVSEGSPFACALKSSSPTPPSGLILNPTQSRCTQSGTSATSFAYATTKPRVLTPKVTPRPGEDHTPPVSLVYQARPPPRRCASAMITPGVNHSHFPLSVSVSRLSRVPVLSVRKNTDGGSSSRSTRGLCAAGVTHSLRQSSPCTRMSFLPPRL